MTNFKNVLRPIKKKSNFIVNIFWQFDLRIWLTRLHYFIRFYYFSRLFQALTFYSISHENFLCSQSNRCHKLSTTSTFCHAHALKWIGHVTCSWKCSWKAVTCVIALVALCSGSVWTRYPEISRLHRLLAATYERDLTLPGGNIQKTNNHWYCVNKERSSSLHTPFPNRHIPKTKI